MAPPTPSQFRAYLLDEGLGDETINEYVRVVKRWQATLAPPKDSFPPGIPSNSAGGDALSAASDPDNLNIVTWARSLNLEERPATTVTVIRSAVIHWLRFTDTPFNPDRLRRQLRGRSAQRIYRHALGRDRVDMLMQAIEESSIPEPAYTILLILPWTGLRITAACRLRRNALQGRGKWLDVVGKGNKSRKLPIGKTCRKILQDYRREAPTSRWMFPSPLSSDKPYAAATVRKYLRQVRAELPADLQAVTPHVMRHCYATWLLEKGVPLRNVQDLMGHSSINTTARYAVPTLENLTSDVDLLED